MATRAPSRSNSCAAGGQGDAWTRKSRHSRRRQQSRRPRHDVRHDQAGVRAPGRPFRKCRSQRFPVVRGGDGAKLRQGDSCRFQRCLLHDSKSLAATQTRLVCNHQCVRWRAQRVADNLDRLDLQGCGRSSRSNPQRRTGGPRDSGEYPEPRPDGHGDVRSCPRRRAGRGGKGRPPNQQSKQAVGPAFGNREAGGLPCVGRFCVRGRGRLLDRRRGHGHFGRGCLSLVITHEEVMPSKPMSTAPALSAGPRSNSRPWTLALTSVAAFMVVLDMLVVVTALPAIRREFGASLAALQWTVNAFTLAFAAGLITQTLGWHWIFWVNVPIGVIATMLVRQKLSESFGPRTRMDLAGVGLVSLGALSLVWGLVRAADTGWSETMTLGALAVGVISLSAFLAWEARATDPMLPLRLFRSRPFLGANATGFLMIGSLSASVFLVAQYFQLGLGYSPMQTGLRLLPWTAAPPVLAPLFGKLSDRIGRRPILSLGTFLHGVGIEWLAILASDHVNYSALVPPLILSGVGISMSLPVVPTAALSAVPPSDIGKASGVNSTLQRFGSVFAVAVASAVFGAFGKLGAADTFLSGFRPALGVVGALALLASVTALAVTSGPLLRSDERRGRPAQEEIGADNAVIRTIKNNL